MEHSDRPDVVLGLVFETVDTAVQREFCRPPDQAVLALARSPRLGRVVIADPWRSGPVDFAKGRSCRQHSTEQVREVRVERVHPRRLRRSDPLSDEKLEQSYTRYKREIGRLGGFSVDSGAVFVTYHPFAAAWGSAEWIKGTVYVGQDDFAYEGATHPGLSSAYDRAQSRLMKSVDSVFAVSDELVHRIAPGRGTVLPNGVDERLWDPSRRGDDARWSVGEPYAVYAGVVEGRVDDSLFSEVLKVIPRIVVAGKFLDRQQELRCRRIAGVEVVGSLGQSDLIDLIRGARVGLIPHYDTPMTRAMSPLKLYEYLAAGIPVVATDLPPLSEGAAGGRVFRCFCREDWERQTMAALALGSERGEKLLQRLSQISWSKRFEPLIDRIVDLGGGRCS